MRKAKGERNSDERSGTQSVERAVGLLREISARGQFGWQLSDLSKQCGLNMSTAHRILTCLVQEGLVKQRPGGRRYLPGPLLYELGLSALPERWDLQHAARSRLSALAGETSGVAFLFFRSGDDFVCGARVGKAELRAPVFPGTRLPLVLSSGGAAMLLALPEPEALATVERNLAHLADYSEVRIQAIRHMLDSSFAEGFGVNVGDIIPGVNAFGLPLCDAMGSPFAAIAVAGPAQAFPPERRTEIYHLLEEAAIGLRAARC